MWLGMLASDQPQVVSIVGLVIVIFWGKTSRGIALSMMLFAALGASHKIFHDRFQPVPARTECAEWRCTLSSHHDPLSRLYSCSSVYYPLGTLVEWTGNFPPALNRSFLAQLRPFRSRSNFDVARWKNSKGISGELAPIEPLRSDEQNLLNRIKARAHTIPSAVKLRHKIKNALDTSFAGEVHGFLYAIVIGDKTKLTFNLRSIFAQTGLAHLLAVSGYHVGLICFIPLLFLRINRLTWRLFGLALIIATAWGFVSVCGWPASGSRAATMITLYAIARVFHLQINPIQVWSVTLILMLLKNPTLAFDLGTQLSFSAVLSILLFAQIVSSFRSGQNASLAIGIPIVAQLGTIATAMPTFNIFPFYFLPFNIAAQLAMTTIGLLFGAWSISYAIDFPQVHADFFSQALSSWISLLIHWLGFCQQNFVLAANLERTPRWIWIAMSLMFFYHALRCIQFKERIRSIFTQFAASILIIVPWGLLAPLLRNPITLKQYRKPVLQIYEGSEIRMIAFDPVDSAAVHRRSILSGAQDPFITCLTPGKHWVNDKNEYFLWLSHEEAIGHIAKRPCNYRYTGEDKGTIRLEGSTFHWESWGDNQQLN